MTLMTMIMTATPSITPTTEMRVITETNVRLGRKYRNASSSSKGNPDMAAGYSKTQKRKGKTEILKG